MSIVLSGLTISGNASGFRNFTVVATTADLDSIGNGTWVYSGDTITAGTAGTTTIDGYTLADGDSVLVKNQIVGLQNGIYEVSDAGVGVPTVLTRASYLFTGVGSNSFQTWIQRGTVNFSSSFISTAAVGSDIIGTHDPLFVQYDARGTLTVDRGGTGALSITTEYTTPQTNTTYSVPADAKSLFVILMGAGGGGGGGNNSATSPGGGGGGGAGLYRQFSIPVTSSDTVTVTVGSGGIGGAVGQPGLNGVQGGSTNITINSKQIIASGGGGGGGVLTTGSGGGGGSGGSRSGSNANNNTAGAAGSNVVDGSYTIAVVGVTGAVGRITSVAGAPGLSGGLAISRPDVIVGGSGGGGGISTTPMDAGAGGQCAGRYFAATPGAVATNSASPGASGGSSAMAAGAAGNTAGTSPDQPGAGAGGAGGQTNDADFGVGPTTAGGPGGDGYVVISWSLR